MRLLLATVVAAPLWLFAAAAQTASDRHAGYYYPLPVTEETYVSRANELPRAGREMRLAFVVGLTQEQLAKPYAPSYAIFAKGDESEKLIIVATGDGGFRTLYQARALLAQLTAMARTTRLFQDLAVENVFTFFDLARLLGFDRITISDGETFSHQITLE